MFYLIFNVKIAEFISTENILLWKPPIRLYVVYIPQLENFQVGFLRDHELRYNSQVSNIQYIHNNSIGHFWDLNIQVKSLKKNNIIF